MGVPPASTEGFSVVGSVGGLLWLTYLFYSKAVAIFAAAAALLIVLVMVYFLFFFRRN